MDIAMGLRGRGLGLLLTLIITAAALLQGASYWPGIMTSDAINQYSQAIEGVYDDWHPPVMAWLWRQLVPVTPGPPPMYILQLALYWTGYGLIVRGALLQGQRVAAGLVTACALMPFPLAIMGSVLKDCLMEGLLLSAVGLSVRYRRGRAWAAPPAAILLIFLAGLLRFNAFLATLPLLIPLFPSAFRRTPLRTAAVSLISLAAVLVSMPAVNRLIGADRSNVELSLVIFDLGGITKRTGIDMFPDVGVPNPVAVNARCYRPDKWDSYSSWGHPPCPISFDRVDEVISDSGGAAYRIWVKAVLAHPLAYAEHRAVHFNINSRFLVHDEVQGAAPDHAVDNEWHFTVSSNGGLQFINKLASWSVHSPLGWPIWWMALAAGLLALCPFLPSGALIRPLALSGLLYGLGYLPFSVSSELRYHLWTITSVAVAAAFAANDFAGGANVVRRRVIASFTPAIAAGVLCLLWRLT